MTSTDNSAPLHLCLVKTRNIGDQVLLRYQVEYLKSKLGQTTFSVVTSHPQLFWNSQETIYPSSPRSSFLEAVKLLFFLVGLPQRSFLIFYSTHRNKVILGYIAKYLRVLLFKKTLVLSFKSDFLSKNTWSDFSFEFCRKNFLSALARDYWPSRSALRLALTPNPFDRRTLRNVQVQMESEFKSTPSHFGPAEEQIKKKVPLSEIEPSKGFVVITFGASQEPKMIDLGMIKNLTNYLVEHGHQVVFHKSPVLAPHEINLWNEIGKDPQLFSMVKAGTIRVFENKSFEDFEKFSRTASLFICSDSGPKHLAIANGIPTLSLDYSCPMKDWHFYSLEQNLVLRIKVPCRPNYSYQKGYEWCGLNYCDHLSCHKMDFLKIKNQLDYFFREHHFDVSQAKRDFPEISSFEA